MIEKRPIHQVFNIVNQIYDKPVIRLNMANHRTINILSNIKIKFPEPDNPWWFVLLLVLLALLLK